MTEWTTETLREHLTQLMDQRFRAQEEAIHKAEHASELREGKNNEFRAQLSDQAARFSSRAEVEAKFAALEDKINAKNVQVMLSLGVGFVATLIAVFNFATGLR